MNQCHFLSPTTTFSYRRTNHKPIILLIPGQRHRGLWVRFPRGDRPTIPLNLTVGPLCTPLPDLLGPLWLRAVSTGT